MENLKSILNQLVYKEDIQLFLSAFTKVVEATKDDFKNQSQENLSSLKEAFSIIEDKLNTIDSLKNDVINTSEEHKLQINNTNKEIQDFKLYLQDLEDSLVKRVKSKVKDGKNPDQNKIIEEILSKIKLPEYKEVVLDTPEEIANKLETLTGDARLDFKAIKNAPNFNPSIISNSNKYLGQLLDVDLSGVSFVDGKYTLGGGSYTLPIATASDLGGIKVGSGLSIDAGTGVLSASGGSGSPGGSTTQLQYNNAGAFGGISGATTNGTAITFTTGNLIGADIKSSSSGGFSILSNAGTTIALFGAGGGANSTFYGGSKFDYATLSTVPYFDASKNLVSSSVTPTELGYLSGVTSAIQTQLNAKGDVVGSASAVDSNFVAFDTTTGKLIKDSGFNSSSFATPSDLGSYVPYTGATSAVDLQAQNLRFTTGNIGFNAGGGDELLISGLASSVLRFTPFSTFTADFNFNSLTTGQVYTLPNNTGTFALTSDLSSYELLSNKSTDTSLGTSDTLYPTQNAVKTYVDGLVAGLLDYRGGYDASGNVFPSSGGSGTAGAVLKGDMWVISVAGTLGGNAVAVGDSIIANVDTPGQTSANWNTLNTNLTYVPENVANKVTSLSGASTDTQYPSAKLTYDQLATKLNLSGGTLTGALYGTSASFTSTIAAGAGTSTIDGSMYIGGKASIGNSNVTAASFYVQGDGSVPNIRSQASSNEDVWNGRNSSGTLTSQITSSGAATFSDVLYANKTASDTLLAGEQYLSGGYNIFRTGTDRSFNIDTYNGGSSVNVLKITQAGVTTIAGAATATNFSLSGRGTGFVFGMPDWRIYNNSSNQLIINNYIVDALTFSSSGNATFSNPLSVGTSNSITGGTIELGHASDTTISRVSAGVIAVEGNTVVTTAPGTSGNVLTSNGSAWVSSAPAASGATFWTALAGATRVGNTSFTVTGDQTALISKGMIIKWTESGTVRVAMVSIPSTFSSTTTVTIIGSTMASIDANSLKYAQIGAEVFQKNFALAGNIGATGTDVMNAYYATEPMNVLGVDVQSGTAGTTNSTTYDINKNGTTMFTIKPTLASTVASSPTPFTADTATTLALGDRVSIDVDAVQTTAAIDLYAQLYLFPTRYLNLT